jgi:hypothetical protein
MKNKCECNSHLGSREIEIMIEVGRGKYEKSKNCSIIRSSVIGIIDPSMSANFFSAYYSST